MCACAPARLCDVANVKIRMRMRKSWREQYTSCGVDPLADFALKISLKWQNVCDAAVSKIKCGFTTSTYIIGSLYLLYLCVRARARECICVWILWQNDVIENAIGNRIHFINLISRENRNRILLSIHTEHTHMLTACIHMPFISFSLCVRVCVCVGQ